MLVGSGTALADDPDLTCRIPGTDPAPVLRVVADSRLRLPTSARLVRTAREAPTWLLTGTGHRPASLAPYFAAGVEVVVIRRARGGGLQPRPMLAALAARGVTRVLAEGGASLAAALLAADLVDRVAWFHAPALMGADARAAVAELGVARLAAAPRFRLAETRALGPDVFSSYERS